MTDWLVIWGVSEASGFLFKDVFAPLIKGTLEDYTKDFFKGCISDFSAIAKSEPLKKAVGKALKEFLVLIQDELLAWGLSGAEIRDKYDQATKKFIYDKSIKPILGKAFEPACKFIDAPTLERQWEQLRLPNLPNEFDWNQIAQQYLRKVKVLVRESEELRAILDSQNQEAVRDTLESLTGVPVEFDLKKHQEGILEQYANLRLDSLDTSGCAYNELKLWKMFVPQNVREFHEFSPQVYEIPKEYQRQLQQNDQVSAQIIDPLESYRKTYYGQPTQWIFEVFNDNRISNDNKDSQKVVFLGDPGSGKSTLLQYIALEWAQLSLKEMYSLPTPLLIELRNYSRNFKSGQCKDFLEFFHKGSGVICRLNQSDLHERLQNGNVLVMFDGLDEVFDPETREIIISDIHRFTNDYSKVRVIVTSRVIGYKPQKLRDAGFQHYILQDLEPHQIDDFIERWHNLTFTDDSDKRRKQERLKKAISESPAIRELAGNPLLLTMMAVLNRNQELPRDRDELYSQASRVLLHQWDVERTLIEDYRLDPKTIDYKDKQAMLRQVAYCMQTNRRGTAGNLISESNLEQILRDYLKFIEVNNARDIAKLLIHQLRVRNFILCFFGADYYAFVHRTFLEYFCAWEFAWQFKETQTLSIENLKIEVFGKYWKDETWHEVLRLIAAMIEPKFVGDLVDYLIQQNGNQESSINLFLASQMLTEVRNRSTVSEVSIRLFEAFSVLIRKSNSKDQAICKKAIKAVLAVWSDSSESLNLFKELLQIGKSRHLRLEAIYAISEIAKINPEALTILKDLAKSGNEAAITELVKTYSQDSDTFQTIRTLAQSGNDIAMAELIRIWRDHPDNLPIIKKFTQLSKNKELQSLSIKTLAQYWKHNPDTLIILKTLATAGNLTAIAELAWSWKDDPDTLNILKTLATAGNSLALIELALGWGMRADIIGFLRTFIEPNTRNTIDEYRYAHVTSILNSEEHIGVLIAVFTRYGGDSIRELMERELSKLFDNLRESDQIAEVLQELRVKRRGVDMGHFSTLRTKITDPSILIAALKSLGFLVKTDSDSRGSNGQRVRADVVAVLEGRYDLGWAWNTDGYMDLIVDLWGVAQKHNQTTLINSINQRYAALTRGYSRWQQFNDS